MSDYNLLIDGQMVPGDLTMPVLNPATEEVLVQCPRASNGQLDKAVAAAKAAYPAWAATPNSPSMPPITPRRPGVCRRHEREAALRAIRWTHGGTAFRGETPARSGRTASLSAKPSSEATRVSTMAKVSERLLLLPAFLAGEFDAGRALFRQDAVGRATFAANGLNSGIALLHDERLARHGFADQALGLFPHRLLRHLSVPAMKTEAGL